MEYNVLFGNIGIDYWTRFFSNSDKIYKDDALYKYYEEGIGEKKYERFIDIYKNDPVKGYTCYFNNKPYENYLKSLYNKIKGFDLYVLSEYCPRLINIFEENQKYTSYYILNYKFLDPNLVTFPKELLNNKTNMEASKKSFILYTNNNNIKITPYFDSNTTELKLIQEVTNIEYGKITKFKTDSIQAGYIFINNIKILILNIHLRDPLYYNQLIKIIQIIQKDYASENTIIFGDFNGEDIAVFVERALLQQNYKKCSQYSTCEKDKICSKDAIKCNENIIDSVYKESQKCNKRRKNKLLGLYHKLKDFTLELNKEFNICNLDLNISSHILIPVKLKPIVQSFSNMPPPGFAYKPPLPQIDELPNKNVNVVRKFFLTK